MLLSAYSPEGEKKGFVQRMYLHWFVGQSVAANQI